MARTTFTWLFDPKFDQKLYKHFDRPSSHRLYVPNKSSWESWLIRSPHTRKIASSNLAEDTLMFCFCFPLCHPPRCLHFWGLLQLWLPSFFFPKRASLTRPALSLTVACAKCWLLAVLWGHMYTCICIMYTYVHTSRSRSRHSQFIWMNKISDGPPPTNCHVNASIRGLRLEA